MPVKETATSGKNGKNDLFIADERRRYPPDRGIQDWQHPNITPNFLTGEFIMKKPSIHKMIATIAVCSIGFLSVSAIAAQDQFQREMIQQVQQAKQKLQQAEAAKGSERQKLMDEHMKMMKETMGKMQAMKPKAGMSMQEHEDWINQHQKLMEDMMDQMMGEHHLMMEGK